MTDTTVMTAEPPGVKGTIPSTQGNPVLSGPVLSTFFHYLVPSTIGLVAITTVNLVDGIFVGNHVGGQALASITLLLPYFTLMVAISLMLAIGGSVRAGKYVGAGELTAASAIFSKSLIAAFAVNLVFAIASLGFETSLYQLLGAPPELHPLLHDYFSVIRWALVVQLLTMVLYYFVRADGHPILATTALVAGSLTNIALDAWFIGYLEMGLAGAAYATAIAQLLQFVVLAWYFVSPHKTLHFSLWQRNWSELFHSAYNGVSEFINEISIGLVFLLLNSLLIARVGVTGVAAFSVVNYFIFLSVMLSYGVSDALHLLVSQNYGARQVLRIKQFLLTALSCTLGIGCLLIVALLCWEQSIIGWFLDGGSDATAIAPLASQLLWLIWPLFFVNGLNITISCYLTAVHCPTPSALIASCRSLVFPATLLSLLYLLLPREQDWTFLAALPLAEWCAFLLAASLCYRYRPAHART